MRRSDGYVDDLVEKSIADDAAHRNNVSFEADHDPDDGVWKSGSGSAPTSWAQARLDAQPQIIVDRWRLDRESIRTIQS